MIAQLLGASSIDCVYDIFPHTWSISNLDAYCTPPTFVLVYEPKTQLAFGRQI